MNEDIHSIQYGTVNKISYMNDIASLGMTRKELFMTISKTLLKTEKKSFQNSPQICTEPKLEYKLMLIHRFLCCTSIFILNLQEIAA